MTATKQASRFKFLRLSDDGFVTTQHLPTRPVTDFRDAQRYAKEADLLDGEWEVVRVSGTVTCNTVTTSKVTATANTIKKRYSGAKRE